MPAETQTRDRPSAPQGDGDGADPGGAATATPEAGNGLTAPQREQVTPPTVHERMVAILADLPAIGKDSQNVEQKFMFRSHDAVLNALNPLMAKHGIYVVPDVIERIADKRTTRGGAAMYEVNLLVRYTFVAEDGSWMQASAWGEGTDMGDKATNKAMTMAFKNVLAQSFAVSTAETQDADAGSPEETVAGGADVVDASKQGTNFERAQTQNRRDRIAELLLALDKATNSEPGTWWKLTDREAERQFGVPYSALKVEHLDEVGKTLKAKLDSNPRAVPEKLEFEVPF